MLVHNRFGQMVTLLQATGELGPGVTFYVNNSTVVQPGSVGASDINGDKNSGCTPLNPMSTIDGALALCTASRGDNIILGPGHSENITTAAGLVFDVAGVTVWGQGMGSLRPTITCSGTTDGTDINITAANVRIHNVIFDMTGNDSVDTFIDLDAADCTFSKCYFLLADSGGQVDVGVDVGTGSNRCTFVDCEFFGDTADSVAIKVTAAVSQFTLKRCKFDMVGATSPGCVEFTAAALNCYFEDCFFANRVANATTVVDCNANAVTGAAVRCNAVLGTIATAGSGILPFESTGQAAYIGLVECYCVNDQAASGAGESGALIGATST